MGMTVQLVDERGVGISSPVLDTGNVFPTLLTAASSEKFHQLNHIDLYGQTTFNASQLDVVVQEWDVLARHATSEQQSRLLSEVSELIARARAEVHLFVRFDGD